jgi:hypothetical protein
MICLHKNRWLGVVVVPVVWSGMAFALSPDARLLSLVPPNAQVVAGMTPPASNKQQPGNFLLITRNNVDDLADFLGLSGVDDKRVIHQVILVASEKEPGLFAEHSLLASGSFDQARIFKAAMENGANSGEYRGTPVLSLQPFSRDRGTLSVGRWLAVLDSSVVLFGTVASVRQEIDRHFERSEADPLLTQRLARLRRDDETWSVISGSVQNDDIRQALGSLSPDLVNIALEKCNFQIGIHYGTHIRFEYEFTGISIGDARNISHAVTGSLLGQDPEASSFIADSGDTVNSASARGVVMVSQERYETWLSEVPTRRFERGGTKSRDSE